MKLTIFLKKLRELKIGRSLRGVTMVKMIISVEVEQARWRMMMQLRMKEAVRL